MFLRKFLIHFKNLRPYITNLAEKSSFKNNSSSRSNLILPTVVIGTIIYENHEKFFSMLGLSQSKLKKRIDRWKGIEELEKTIDLNTSDLNLLNEDDYLVKMTEPPKEKPKSENFPSEESSKNNSEKLDYSELLKLSEEIKVKFKNELESNKKNLILNLIEKEELLDHLVNENKNILNQIKSERAKQNKIINHLKDKLTKEEFSNLEKIRQLLDEEKLQTEHLNVINLVLPQVDNYKSLNASIEDLNKLTNEYNKIYDQLLNLNSEITQMNENLKKFEKLEEVYTAKINSNDFKNILLGSEDKKILKETVSIILNFESQSTTEAKNLLIVNSKLFENMKVLYSKIVKTNNKKNLEQLNTLYSNIKQKLIPIFEETKDDFSLEILKNSVSPLNRIYSHIEIENAFEAIKRDLFYEILLHHFSSNEYLRSISPFLSKIFSGVCVNFYLNKYDPFECDIQESDSEEKKLLKAFNFLASNIKYRKYPEAYKNLQYFKNQEKLTVDLRSKLEVMTKELFAIDTLKTHLE